MGRKKSTSGTQLARRGDHASGPPAKIPKRLVADLRKMIDGLILCASKSDEHVELLRLDETGIRVSAYLTELPPRELLEQKLHEAVRAARARLEAQ
jgi:hypothetical protein